MIQPDNSPSRSGEGESLDGLALPNVRSIKPHQFLAEFREMLRAELMEGPRRLALEPARNVTHAVSKLARFLAAEHGVSYSAERELAACQALRDGVLLSTTPPEAERSHLEIILRGGRAAAQTFVDHLSANASNSTKNVESTVSKLRVFLAAAETAGWIESDGVRLKNPRTTKIDWDEFPPCADWRRRSQGEIARGEKSRSYVFNQISIIHSFLEDTRVRYNLSFDPARERKVLEQLRDAEHSLELNREAPRSIIEALVTNGESLVQEFVAESSSDNRLAALRSFYAELREKVPGVLPESLIVALKLPTLNHFAKLPLFERFIDEHYHGGTKKVARKNLRAFGHCIAARHGVSLIETEEKVEWRLSAEGRLMFAYPGRLGPVTTAIRTGARDELLGFKEYLRSRADLRPDYQRDLFGAAKRFLVWASVERLVDDKPESIESIAFEIQRGPEAEKVRPHIKRRAPREKTARAPVAATTSASEVKVPEVPRSSAPLERSFVLAEQARMVQRIIEAPPTAIALGDLFMAHAEDYDRKRRSITLRSAQRSSFSVLEPQLAHEIEVHLERLRRSPFSRAGAKQYGGPIFVDNRGDAILSCNVPTISREIDLARVQFGLNIAHAIYQEVREQALTRVSLADVLRLDLDDVSGSRTAVTLRDPLGDVIGKTSLTSATGATLRTYIEVIRASELGSLWASFNSQKTVFMAPDGYPLGESLPGLTK